MLPQLGDGRLPQLGTTVKYLVEFSVTSNIISLRSKLFLLGTKMFQIECRLCYDFENIINVH